MWHVWGREKSVYKVLMGKPEGKRTLARPRRRWQEGLRMDVGDIDWECVEDSVCSG
jgi:hypothetical protein